MVVQHNITAMNSNRMLGLTQGTLAKSTEKLSSGYKINRAADNAAGLAISEKMRRQVRGLTQASTNAQD
ncbi:MAG: flagellin, partial [Lachnospiraceae bacterium]|nr:flagellin [Lachnospiraceae bacterium]